MSASTARKCFSYLSIASGALLLLAGARDFLEWRLGQSSVAHDFDRPAAVSKPVDRLPTGVAFAELKIPRLGADLFVVEGDGEGELRRGPGHLPGTAMPGGKGNCVIAGHRDTHFRVLKDIRRGDEIMLDTRAGQFRYRVKDIAVVSPDNTGPLQPTSAAELNLITCYPFQFVGAAPRRFVVEARLADAADDDPPPTPTPSTRRPPKIRHAQVHHAQVRYPRRSHRKIG